MKLSILFLSFGVIVSTIPINLINDDQISGLEEFLTAIEDQRTREAIVELLEAKQTTNEKEATSRMKTIMRMLPNDVLNDLLQIYKKTFSE